MGPFRNRAGATAAAFRRGGQQPDRSRRALGTDCASVTKAHIDIDELGPSPLNIQTTEKSAVRFPSRASSRTGSHLSSTRCSLSPHHRARCERSMPPVFAPDRVEMRCDPARRHRHAVVAVGKHAVRPSCPSGALAPPRCPTRRTADRPSRVNRPEAAARSSRLTTPCAASPSALMPPDRPVRRHDRAIHRLPQSRRSEARGGTPSAPLRLRERLAGLELGCCRGGPDDRTCRTRRRPDAAAEGESAVKTVLSTARPGDASLAGSAKATVCNARGCDPGLPARTVSRHGALARQTSTKRVLPGPPATRDFT